MPNENKVNLSQCGSVHLSPVQSIVIRNHWGLYMMQESISEGTKTGEMRKYEDEKERDRQM